MPKNKQDLQNFSDESDNQYHSNLRREIKKADLSIIKDYNLLYLDNDTFNK